MTAENLPALLLHSGSEDKLILEGCEKWQIGGQVSKPIRMPQLYQALLKLQQVQPNTPPIAPSAHSLSPTMERSESRVLVVDDNEFNLKLAFNMLQRLVPKASLYQACDGKEAVTVFATQRPDLVLMDIQMPQMSGYEAAKAIRALDAAAAKVPIIALTAGTVQGERTRALQAGMNDYLSKPVVLKQLGEMLTKWLPTSLAAEPAETELALVDRPQAQALQHFDQQALQRPGAEADYDATTRRRANERFERMGAAERDRVARTVLAGLPGSEETYTVEAFQEALDAYRAIGADELRANLVHFLRAVVPVAEEVGVQAGALYRYAAGEPSGFTLRVNGEPVEAAVEQGFAVVDRRWRPGDRIELELPMPVRFSTSDERVEVNRGRVAVTRGPLVMAAEEFDNGRVQRLALGSLPEDEDIAVGRLEIAEGHEAVNARLPGVRRIENGAIPTTISLVPYYAWNNRGDGSMIVWMEL